MPPNEARLSRDHPNVPKGQVIEHLKGLKINEGRDNNRNRRATSFKERPETGGENLRRVRSFKTTSKGLVNRGDTVNVRNDSDYNRAKSSEKNSKSPKRKYLIPQLITSKCSEDQRNFRVLLTGAGGVGKTSLIQQFMTSEYLGSGNINVCK
jgi:Rad/Gem-related GTP binding protein 1